MTSRRSATAHLCIALGVILAAPASTAAQPRIDRAVTDQTGVLSPEAISAIEGRLVAHHEEGHPQIALLLVRTTGGVPIADYALQAAVAWGGGSHERDDGALFVLALDDHEMRIEVGYGLEPTITDATAARILEELVEPLRAERFDLAAWVVSDELIARTGGAHLDPPAFAMAAAGPRDASETDAETPEERATREARRREADARSEEATMYGAALALFFVLATLGFVVLLTRGQGTSYGAGGATATDARNTIVVTVGAAVAFVVFIAMLVNGYGVVSFMVVVGVVIVVQRVLGGSGGGSGSSGSSRSHDSWRSSSRSHGSSGGSSSFGGGGGRSHGGGSYGGGGGGFGGGGASKRW